MNTTEAIARKLPRNLKVQVRRFWNTDKHAEMYAVLEDFLSQHHGIYEDGTVYTIGKLVAGVA
jgi:hypothetical protein